MGRSCFTLRLLLLLMLPVELFLLPASRAAAQTAAAAHSASSPVDVALDHFRNLEHDLAQKQLQAWVAEHPNDLRALNYLAIVILQREMVRRGLLQAQVYGPQGEAFKPDRAPLTPGVEKEFFSVLGKAETLAETRVKQNQWDQEALYWAGVTHLTKALFHLTLAKAYLTALGDAKEARSYHTRLLALNPSFVDALLVVGIYDYAVGGLPWYAKVVASLVGPRGDKARGLAEMKRVTQEGQWAREDAKPFLAILYFREKMYPEALALLQGLTQSYPRNYLLEQEIARVYKAMGNIATAAKAYDDMLAKRAAGEPGFSAMPFAQILYQAGEVRAQLGQLDEALRRYEQAAKLDENNLYVYRAEFEAAGLCWRLNRREDARRKYERVVRAIPETAEGRSARQTLKRLQETRPAPSEKAK